MTLTLELLKEFLHYNPETGIFTWLDSPLRRNNQAKGWVVAGDIDNKGYCRIGIKGRRYQSHRLAWFYVHGEFPPKHIDHVNRIKTDNRISNLRAATSSENQANRTKSKNNKSGYKGVSFDKNPRYTNRWRSVIVHNKKQIAIGHYKTAELAYEAYCNAAKKLNGEFAAF